MMIKVRLRKKSITNGRCSLYLDFYPEVYDVEKGTRSRRQFLGMHIYSRPNGPEEKAHNRNTLQIAEQMRINKENRFNKPEVYSEFERERIRVREKGMQEFLPYFLRLSEIRTGTNRTTWLSCYKHLKKYARGRNIRFADIDARFIEGFRIYLEHAVSLRARYSMLESRISCNTRAAYLFKLKHALRMAYRDGILESDLTVHFGIIRTDEVQRLYLTLDELNRLAASDCVFPELKRAALFSALTGLRFSDIEKLVWGEVEQMDGDGHAAIVFRQKKTKNMQAMPLSEQALQLLGPRGHSAQRVFDGLKYSTQVTRYLRDWASYAQVSKPITFHCFRHTFATLQFNSGTDIYTVSKLLGNKELKTTQIYVRLMDSAKWAAVNRIRIDMPGIPLPRTGD
jgi:integrase